MLNFDFISPTKFVFGKDVELQVGQITEKYGKKVLIHFGGSSAKKSGLLDKVKKCLTEEGLEYIELGGVQPNPRDTLVYKGIEICKKEGVDVILAVGGGSVIDSAKAIAIGALYDGDFWDFYSGKIPEKRLALGVVLTLPATGSEGSFGSVVTRERDMLKRDCCCDLLRPDFAIMNPELTYTLPPYQTACGICDIMAHVIERYMTNTTGVEITSYLAEAILNTVITSGYTLLNDPYDYDARANIMWAGMLAHNNLVGVGREQDWSSHQLEHELSGLYDVAHGAGLSVVLPAFMKYQYKHNISLFARLAVNVFGVKMDFEHPEKTALQGIEAMEAYFKLLGLPTTFKELGAKEEDIEALVNKCAFNNGDLLGYLHPLTREEACEVLRLACK